MIPYLLILPFVLFIGYGMYKDKDFKQIITVSVFLMLALFSTGISILLTK